MGTLTKLIALTKLITLTTKKVPSSTEKVPLSTEIVPKYCGTGTGDLGWSRGVHRHPYCRVFKLKKSKKRKIRIFEKPDFPDPDFRISVHGVAMGAERATCGQNFIPLAAVVSEALRNPDFRKTGFPGPDPD